MNMGWDELYVRTCQEIAKRWDLLLPRIAVPIMPDRSICEASLSDGFFFKPDELPGILAMLRERLPGHCEQTIERADRICEHRFDLLGHEDIKYGPEIDWHLDAVHGKRAPLRPWFQVRYLDFGEVGDSKVTWELNRHQHLILLAKAYLLTAEPRYAEELFCQWYNWQQHNPYGIGINWASSLEVALRSLSWLWIWHLLRGSSVVPTTFSHDLCRALMLSARHVERFLSIYFSPNTHLLGEGMGLFAIGSSLKGSSHARRWQQRGWDIVLREAQRQVRPDGMHFEQSTYYHVYALDMLLHCRMLAAAMTTTVPQALDDTIERMLEVLSAFAGAGQVPSIGDDDGGRIFDPRRNRARHLTDPMATGAALFNRADFKVVATDVCEETIWLLGTRGTKRFDQLEKCEHTAVPFALGPSGFYVMSSSRPTPQRLVIDAGPHGAGRAGHGHADALSVELSINHRPVLVDPGTFTYTDGVVRDHFRGTSAHNTVQIDGLSQSEPFGPFGWKCLPQTYVDRWVTGSTFTLFSGWHTGYRRLPSPVTHRRDVLYLKPHFWLVREVLDGCGVHQCDVFWHFAPGVVSEVDGGAIFVGETSSLQVLFATDQAWTQEIVSDWSSPVYGRREHSRTLRFSLRAQLPCEFATLLAPSSEHIRVFRQLGLGPESTRAEGYQVHIGNLRHDAIFAAGPGTWQLDRYSSDARFLCSSSAEAEFREFAMHEGSFVDIDHRRLFTAESVVPIAEWHSQQGSLSPQEHKPCAESVELSR